MLCTDSPGVAPPLTAVPMVTLGGEQLSNTEAEREHLRPDNAVPPTLQSERGEEATATKLINSPESAVNNVSIIILSDNSCFRYQTDTS